MEHICTENLFDFLISTYHNFLYAKAIYVSKILCRVVCVYRSVRKQTKLTELVYHKQ